MSDGLANGTKIPRLSNREFSLPNRNHLTPRNRGCPAEQANLLPTLKLLARRCAVFVRKDPSAGGKQRARRSCVQYVRLLV